MSASLSGIRSGDSWVVDVEVNSGSGVVYHPGPAKDAFLLPHEQAKALAARIRASDRQNRWAIRVASASQAEGEARKERGS